MLRAPSSACLIYSPSQIEYPGTHPSHHSINIILSSLQISFFSQTFLGKHTSRLSLSTDKIHIFIHFLPAVLIYSLSQIEYRAKSEALRLREMEQRELERKYGKKKAKEVAEQNFQERIENFEREEFEEEKKREQKTRLIKERMSEAEMRKNEPIDDSAVVDDMFGFLEEQRDSVNEHQAPSAFRDLPAPKGGAHLSNGEVIMGVPTTPEDFEDLSEFKFQKYASTYFQGNVTHQYSRKPLKYSLLPLQTQGDQLVSKN